MTPMVTTMATQAPRGCAPQFKAASRAVRRRVSPGARGLEACVTATVLLVVLAGGCDRGQVSGDEPATVPSATAEPLAGVPVQPPFAVGGDLEGLMLVWFDEEGAHPAERLADVPEAARGRVRVDSLTVPPEKRLPPDQVYVADLREPGADGVYPVRQLPRAALDAEVAAVVAAAAPKAEEVVIYKASWCGVCKQAASYLRARKVPFIERDVEKDAGADAEMRKKANAAGKSPRGVPVIDFRGHILLGFDRPALEALIDQG